MKALLPLLTLLLLSASLVSAQATPTSTDDWTTVQRCITTPSQPPPGWTYNGVIFTYKHGDGVHARRADVATPYYIAFENDSEYLWAGSFSPDGRWFAVPEGKHVNQNTGSLDNQYWIDELHIYSTTPTHSLYRINVDWDTYLGTSIGIAPQWLDNDHILYPTGVDMAGPQWKALNPFSGDAASYTGALPLSLSQRAADLGIRAEVFPDDLQPLVAFQDYDYPNILSFSEAKDHFAFTGKHGGLQIGNMVTRQIVDSCIQSAFSGIALSPDGEELAFGLNQDGYVYILDLQAWQAYRIDLAAADVIGWYPGE